MPDGDALLRRRRAARTAITVWSRDPDALRRPRLRWPRCSRSPQAGSGSSCPTLGGGYGAKCYPKIEPVAALLLAGRRPAGAAPPHPRGGVRHDHQARRPDPDEDRACRADGTIVARQSTCHFNTGAYADIGPRLIKNGGYRDRRPAQHPERLGRLVRGLHEHRRRPAPSAATACRPGRLGLRDPDGHDRRAARARSATSSGCGTCSRDGDTVMTGEPMRGRPLPRAPRRAPPSWIGWDPAEAPAAATGTQGPGQGPLSCIIKAIGHPVDLDRRGEAQRRRQPAGPDQLGRDGPGRPDRAWRSSPARGWSVPDRADPHLDARHRRHALRPADQLEPLHPLDGPGDGAALDEIRVQLLALAAEALEVSRGRPRARRRLRPGEGLARPGDRLRRARPPVAARQPPGQRRPIAARAASTPRRARGSARVHWHQAAGAAEVEVDLETGRVEVLRYHAGGLRRPDGQPGPGRAPDRGQRRLRPGPGAVRGDGLRRAASSRTATSPTT